jgi:hypothetical protein
MPYEASARPDLGAVGASAQVSKGSTRQPEELVSFSVKKGDNGGVIVCETYERKAPAGRRASSFVLGGDYKENPFSPDDGGAAQNHIKGLLSQLGVAAADVDAAASAAMGASGPSSGGDEGY